MDAEYALFQANLKIYRLHEDYDRVRAHSKKLTSNVSNLVEEAKAVGDDARRSIMAREVTPELFMLLDFLVHGIEFAKQGIDKCEVSMKEMTQDLNRVRRIIPRLYQNVEEAKKAERMRLRREADETRAYNTINRARDGWGPHQDDDPELYKKHFRPPKSIPMGWAYFQDLGKERAAQDEKLKKAAKEWYAATLEAFKDRKNIASFPIPPACSTCSDVVCHLKPRPLAPACQCSIRKAFESLSDVDLKEERLRWHPDRFVAYPEYQHLASEVFTVVDDMYNGEC